MSKKENELSVHRRYIRIHGKLISKRFLRKTDADRWYLEKKREKELVESGVHKPTEEMELGEYLERWSSMRIAQGKPESSTRAEERRIRLHIIPVMGKRILQKICRREWEEFLDSLVVKKKLKPATRNRVQSLVSKMYNDALRQDIVTSNPLSAIPKLREAKDTFDFWESRNEISRYLEASQKQDSFFRIFAMLALNTGARLGEVLALRYQDVQLERRSIHIWRTYEQESRSIVERTKGHADRWLGINETLYQAVLEHREHQEKAGLGKPSDLLICNVDGQSVPEWTIRQRHYRICEDSELRSIRVHDLRHTYASHYVMSGGSLMDPRSLLGHSTAEMTLKYAHLAPGHLQAKCNVVSFAPSLGSSSPQDFSAPVRLAKND